MGAALLGGCATAYTEGARAYSEGRYAAAAERFGTTLSENPERLDALVGLGLSRYRLGDWNRAIVALEPAVGRMPQDQVARLYVALAHLQGGDVVRAQEHLAAFRTGLADPRLGASIERALGLLRAPLSPEVRAYVATTLDDAAQWQRETAETRAALLAEETLRLMDEHVIYVPSRCRC